MFGHIPNAELHEKKPPPRQTPVGATLPSEQPFWPGKGGEEDWRLPCTMSTTCRLELQQMGWGLGWWGAVERSPGPNVVDERRSARC